MKHYVALTLLLLGCAPKHLPPQMGSPEWGVQITWHGHSCFTLRDSVDRTVVIDPFDDTVGYGHLILRADALLVSHAHFDHNEKRAVKARLKNIDLVESTGTATVASEFSVTGIPSYHDNVQGQIHGPNRIYAFSLGGLRIVHLGDLGQEKLLDWQKAQIGTVDILMIPVGGVTTLDGSSAKAIVDELKPAVVFPMHYGNTRFYPLAPVESFTNLFPPDQIVKLDLSQVQIRRAELTGKPLIYVLTPIERNY